MLENKNIKTSYDENLKELIKLVSLISKDEDLTFSKDKISSTLFHLFCNITLATTELKISIGIRDKTLEIIKAENRLPAYFIFIALEELLFKYGIKKRLKEK